MSDKPHPAQLRKLLAAARQAKVALGPSHPALIYLTDPDRSKDPIGVATRLPAGSAVIYRHFGAANRVDIARGLRASTICSGCRLLIANDPELAMIVKADGVHWPERQLHMAKYWRRRFNIMTASAHSVAALQSSSVRFVDAALFSTVFASSSPSASSPIGALKFRTIGRSSPLPVYALGGVTGNNAQSVAEAGGIAAISGMEDVFV